jgi:hypothetical protein
MTLKAVLDSLDGVPEELHQHYEQDGEVFHIRVDGYDDTGLKHKVRRLEAKNVKLEERLGAVPDNFDVAELEELRKLRQTVQDEQAKAAGDWDKLKGDMEARHGKELESVKSNNATLADQLEQIIKKDAATAALADAGARVTAMLPHVLDRVSVVTEDGNRRAVATGLDGEPTDISGLVSQMREAGEDWDWGFQSTGATGGGSAGRGSASRAGQVRTKADLGESQSHAGRLARSAYIKEHGVDAFKELPNG